MTSERLNVGLIINDLATARMEYVNAGPGWVLGP